MSAQSSELTGGACVQPQKPRKRKESKPKDPDTQPVQQQQPQQPRVVSQACVTGLSFRPAASAIQQAAIQQAAIQLQSSKPSVQLARLHTACTCRQAEEDAGFEARLAAISSRVGASAVSQLRLNTCAQAAPLTSKPAAGHVRSRQLEKARSRDSATRPRSAEHCAGIDVEAGPGAAGLLGAPGLRSERQHEHTGGWCA